MTAVEMRVFQRPSRTKMGIFERPEGAKTVPIQFRFAPEMVESLDAVMRLWQLVESAHEGNPKAIDRTFVVRRLLNVGIDSAFAEFGMKPETPEEWKKLEQLIAKKFGR